MGPFRDIRLSQTGTLILAAVSLAATIIILASGSSKSDAELAALAYLKHPHHTVVLEAAAASPPGNTGSASATSSPPASDSGASSASSGSSGGSSSSGTAGTTSSGSTNSGGGSETSSASTTTSTTATTTTTAADAGLPKVGHVFLLTLSTNDYKSAFGAGSAAPYLRRLARRGTVLTGYHSLAKHGLADLLAMVSGQPPNADTIGGCDTYAAFPESASVNATTGVASGKGCIYPEDALTIADEATAAGKTWGAYVEDMGANNCSVPQTGDPLDTLLDGTQEGYDLAHNPFAFFGSLLDAGGCSEYDEDLSNLPAALARKASTPDFTYLSGDACVDADPTFAPATTTTTATGTTTAASSTGTGNTGASPSTGTGNTGGTTTTTATTTTATSTTPARLIAPAAYGCPVGEPSGIAGENAFLQTWVPKILASAAYKANGVLVIAFTGANGAAHAKTGALVLSRWTPRDRKITTPYTAYSLLHSVEDMLDLAPLADATDAPAFAKLVLR